MIRLAHNFDSLAGDLADDPDPQTWSREGVSANELLVDLQLPLAYGLVKNALSAVCLPLVRNACTKTLTTYRFPKVVAFLRIFRCEHTTITQRTDWFAQRQILQGYRLLLNLRKAAHVPLPEVVEEDVSGIEFTTFPVRTDNAGPEYG